MKTLFGFTVGLTLLLSGCGMSAADKAAAGAALGSFSSLAQASRQIIADDLAAGRSCSDSTYSSGGVTVTVTCTSGTEYSFRLTATGPVDRTCGTETVSVKDLDATFTLTVNTRATWVYTSDVTATVNDKALACRYGFSFDLSAGAVTVDSSGYECTYGGSSLAQDAITAASCST